jgi:hypothetical protein
MAIATKKAGVYHQIISEVFQRNRKNNATRFEFSRSDLLTVAKQFGIVEVEGDEKTIAKNLGDIVYTYRFRKDFPPTILQAAPKGKMWIITGKGDARYEFRLITQPSLGADPDLVATKIHDATPEIVRRFELGDEQAVLARIRYNRLIDLFCKCVAYSLQNHLRTKMEGIGQIEIDELYAGTNRTGELFIIPVQVKREKDRLGVSQLMQDLEYCRREHPEMKARALGAQKMAYSEGGKTFERIVLFEFECEETKDDVRIKKIAERHFVLLPHRHITVEDLRAAKRRSEADTADL